MLEELTCGRGDAYKERIEDFKSRCLVEGACTVEGCLDKEAKLGDDWAKEVVADTASFLEVTLVTVAEEVLLTE